MITAALVATSCTSGKDDDTTSSSAPETTGATGSGEPTVIAASSLTSGQVLPVRLSQGRSQTAAAQPTEVLPGDPVDPARVAEILSRLPEWTVDAASRQAFNWPTESLAPPTVGTTVDVPFPAATTEAAPQVPTGPLEVLRYQPEGEVAVAPFVSITFNQPMVPLGTVSQLDGAAVPATISPAIPGRWQWIGTRTLRFDADFEAADRLPMATEYTVEIPAGTTSATGAELGEGVSWTFATPPVQVRSFAQQDATSLALDTVFVATFDQAVDQAAVLASIRLTADDDEQQIRLATADEIEASDVARQTTASTPDGRWIAFRAVEPLPTDAAIEVAVGPETPSTEGPRTTTEAMTYSARTYPPLKIAETTCSWGLPCPPGTDIIVRFNNPLDADAFDPSTITISPALPGFAVGVSGDILTIRGRTAGRTTYEIGIPAGVTDVFGQTLGDDATTSLKIGPAAQMLQPFTQPLTTLDPHASGRSLPVNTVNHDSLRVRTYRVEPTAWSTYLQTFLQFTQGDTSKPAPTPPWEPFSDSTIELDTTEDQVTETEIDLAAAFDDGNRHVVVVVEPTETFSVNSEDYWQNRPTLTWVQSTDIGIDAAADSEELSIWTTSLTDGTPLGGVSVQLVRGVQFDYSSTTITTEPVTVDATATTDDRGLARTDLRPGDSFGQGTAALIVTNSDDSAILPAGYYGENWQRYEQTDSALWYTFDDRGIYRPGETASIKGWVRRSPAGGDAQLALIERGATIAYTAYDAQGVEFATGSADVNLLGGFDVALELPDGANLGYASVNFRLEGASGFGYAEYQHSLRIEEFRRPEFEVTARNESPAPYRTVSPATVAVDASYFAGGPLAAAPVAWQVTTAKGTYSPPGWDRFTFGIWTPWWISAEFDSGARFGGECCFPDFPGTDQQTVEQFAGVTDSNGEHYLQIDFDKPEGGFPDLPVTVSAQATVTDVNRQAWSSTTDLLVHPAAFYVGLSAERTFVNEGDPLDISVIATDIDGAAVTGRAVTVTASRLEWVYADGNWTEEPAATETCETTSAPEPVTCTFATSQGGTYRIGSTIVDDDGGRSRSELTRWVSGGSARPARNVEQETATIIPDKASYQPGETAELLIQSPFSPAKGLVTTTHNGIASTEVFDIADGTAVVRLPITEASIPALGVTVELVGSAQRLADDGTPLADTPPRAAYAIGELTLHVPPTTRTLTVTATPADDDVAPGSDTSVAVTVTDADGTAVEGAEFAVVVVDEAVLSLSGYQLASPVDAFYPDLPTYLQTVYGRQSIILANPLNLAERDADTADGGAPAATEAPAEAASEMAPSTTVLTSAAPAADRSMKVGDAAAGSPVPAIDLRTNFDALAVFQPEVTTDANGAATIEVPLPDNLTRYRVMVVAVDGADRFGSTESNITARLPLMVRPSAPRFLNFGDIFELPVVVQNQSDSALEVDVVVQADNLSIDGGVGTGTAAKRVSVPANDRVEVRFPAAADEAGTASFRVVAASGELSDAATGELPVYTPATAEAFATYGVLDEGAVIQPVLAPVGVIPQFGSLDITTSSTSLQALTDAVIYLSEYPYDSADGAASQIMAISSLRPVLDAFDAPGLPAPATLDAAVVRAVERLRVLQNGDGGFSFWVRDERSDPFVSIQAAHALVLAKLADYPVAQGTIDMAMSYLYDIENRIPAEWGEDTRDSLSAYALTVRALNGDRDSAKAAALWQRRGEDLPVDAIAWLWTVIDDPAAEAAIERVLANRVVETAGAANFSTDYGDDANFLLYSDRRSDGIVLDALIGERPDSDLIPKVVAGLLGNQTKGRWNNVQENAFILLALEHYFETYESQTPDFVARVWLGDRYAGSQIFDGRTTDRTQVSIPTADVIAAGDSDIVISREGTGRLYYRLGVRTAPDDLTLDPLDRGFVVDRLYQAVDDPSDVSRDADGTWRIRAGARVRVTLSMVAESQRTHVALIDPLPAGFEILNPALATTQELPPTADDNGGAIDGPIIADSSISYPGIWWGTWFNHQNLGDDRAEAFASLLPAGTYDYSYVVRATTPGTFVTPPTRAEEIYAPETFGRGATAVVVIS